MICLLQRVSQAQVCVNQQTLATIQRGLVVLTGFQPQDTQATLDKMVHKLLHYRVFPDKNDKMNLNIQQALYDQVDSRAELLIVPQFTLAANTQKGLRPSFSSSAAPAIASQLFEEFLNKLEQAYCPIQAGKFGANMQVTLTNDGPVTFWLEIN